MKLRVFAELIVFEGLACFVVKNLHYPFCEEHDGVGAAGNGFISGEACEAGVTILCARRYGS